ncbi:MAG: NAD-dependent epimerase/dehydratase family protein [Deltaproteobacteria bacterium]|nr:NAD-dependent epimerase/dehydratase family protein [Deltaproteobacteria bacterium]
MMQNKKHKPLQNRHIALIGTSGFKGRTLLKKLEADSKIKKLIVIDRKRPPFELKKAKFYKLDLTENLADARLAEIFSEEKIHTVIHTAIPSSPPQNNSLSHEIISVGSMYICNAAAAAQVQKFILVSSTMVYGAFANNPNFMSETHPLRGGIKNKFLADKVDAEKSVMKLAQKHPEMTVTILRTATLIGPTVQSYKTRYLSRPMLLTILGYDPLIQFLHEDDCIEALQLAVEKDIAGVFNVVAEGVLPLSRVLHILRKIEFPLPEFIAKNVVQSLWYLNISPAPKSLLNFLKYLCVADGEKAKKELGFHPKYSSREALLTFVGAERLRDVALDIPEEVLS